MKKLSKMQLKDAVILDDQQLKHVLGGSGAVSTNCSVTCDSGQEVKITDCVGDCSAGSSGVTCSGATAILSKPCPSSGSGSGSSSGSISMT